MKKHPYIVSVLALLLSACSSSPTPKQIVEAPACANLCGEALSQYPFVQLEGNEKFKLDIDANSPVGQFSQGNSHFAAFKLSERSAETQITLSAMMINDSVFAPEIMLLSADHQIVHTYSLTDFDILPSDAFTRTRFVKRITVNAEESPYLVVYTQASSLGETIQVEHPARRRAREFGEVMPMVTDPRYVFQPTGEIELEIKSLKMRPIREDSVQATDNSLTITPLPETQSYYLENIANEVHIGNLDKALALLEEAKALNIEGAQQAFVNAVEGNNLK